MQNKDQSLQLSPVLLAPQTVDSCSPAIDSYGRRGLDAKVWCTGEATPVGEGDVPGVFGGVVRFAT